MINTVPGGDQKLIVCTKTQHERMERKSDNRHKAKNMSKTIRLN